MVVSATMRICASAICFGMRGRLRLHAPVGLDDPADQHGANSTGCPFLLVCARDGVDLDVRQHRGQVEDRATDGAVILVWHLNVAHNGRELVVIV